MRTWAHAAAVRAIRTVGQTAAAMIGTAVVLAEIDWVMVASASAVAGILSIATSLGGLPEVSGDVTPPPDGYEPRHRADG